MIREQVGDLFRAEPWQTFMVPVAADYRLFGPNACVDRVCGIGRALRDRGFGLCPDALYVPGALVIVPKKDSDGLMTEYGLEKALQIAKRLCEKEGITQLAMVPLWDDNIPWYRTKALLLETLGAEITVNVYKRAWQGGL